MIFLGMFLIFLGGVSIGMIIGEWLERKRSDKFKSSLPKVKPPKFKHANDMNDIKEWIDKT